MIFKIRSDVFQIHYKYKALFLYLQTFYTSEFIFIFILDYKNLEFNTAQDQVPLGACCTFGLIKDAWLDDVVSISASMLCESRYALLC